MISHRIFPRVMPRYACFIMAMTIHLGGYGADKPNVIVIMADDIGAEGLGCYGSTIYTTPNLDRMAQEGARFNNAYATPLCTPTRVMIMSGLYPNRTGFRGLISKDDGVRMPTSIKTFGNYFHDAGYATAIAGKWQLGKFDEIPEQPKQHGFDEYCMWTWVYNGQKTSRYYKPHIYQDAKFIQGAAKDYGPDFYHKFIIDFIERKKDQPFFVYFPMALVHNPFDIPPQLGELASRKFTADMDKQTKAFGHMITYMDYVVGDIFDTLRKHGLDKNTLVLFTGDNGTNKSITSKLQDLSIHGGKGSMTEAGTRVPLMAWWPGKINPGVREQLFSLADVLPTITAIAGIPLSREVDGMNLSHNLLGGDGKDREQILVSFGKGYFARDKQFRLNQDGKFYNIPVDSDSSRYSERAVSSDDSKADHDRLQQVLKQFMAIETESFDKGNSDGDRKGKEKKKNKSDKPPGDPDDD